MTHTVPYRGITTSFHVRTLRRETSSQVSSVHDWRAVLFLRPSKAAESPGHGKWEIWAGRGACEKSTGYLVVSACWVRDSLPLVCGSGLTLDLGRWAACWVAFAAFVWMNFCVMLASGYRTCFMHSTSNQCLHQNSETHIIHDRAFSKNCWRSSTRAFASFLDGHEASGLGFLLEFVHALCVKYLTCRDSRRRTAAAEISTVTTSTVLTRTATASITVSTTVATCSALTGGDTSRLRRAGIQRTWSSKTC